MSSDIDLEYIQRILMCSSEKVYQNISLLSLFFEKCSNERSYYYGRLYYCGYLLDFLYSSAGARTDACVDPVKAHADTHVSFPLMISCKRTWLCMCVSAERRMLAYLHSELFAVLTKDPIALSHRDQRYKKVD